MENEEDIKTCSNCGRPFPQNKIDLHEAYCVRNFRKCEFCGVMIDRNYLADHEKEFHSEKECEYCHKKYMPNEEQNHLITCEHKPEKCQFCENVFPASQIVNHREVCGSRTKKCVLCNKYVMLRDIDSHLVRCMNRRERRENSQNQREAARDAPQQLYRQNSSNNIQGNKPKEKSNKQLLIPKIIKFKEANVIGPQVVGKRIDPVPIGIKLAIQKKNFEKMNRLKEKNSQDKGSPQKKDEMKNEYY